MKRSKEAIITKVLEVCIYGASKTAVVYQANPNFHTVIIYRYAFRKTDVGENR